MKSHASNSLAVVPQSLIRRRSQIEIVPEEALVVGCDEQVGAVRKTFEAAEWVLCLVFGERVDGDGGGCGGCGRRDCGEVIASSVPGEGFGYGAEGKSQKDAFVLDGGGRTQPA